MIALLSTVQSLPDGVDRTELERALVPLARDAALGALAPGLAHDAGNALFGLVGLLGLIDDDVPLGRERLALLRQSASDLDTLVRPALEFVRSSRDDRPTADLGAAARLAVTLYAHGDHPPVDAHIPDGETRVACPVALAQQAVIHLLLAATPAGTITLELAGSELRVAPAGAETLDEVVARRIALDHGGSLERDGTALRLRLRPA
jgi:signal transduction histidine kinase